MTDVVAVNPRLRERKVAVARAAGRRRLRLVLSVAAVPAFAAGVLLVLHSSLLSARHVQVSGESHTSVATVLAVTGLAHHPPLIDINPAAETAALERLPWVAHASVVPEWPSGVRVHLVERVPVAFVLDGPGRAAVLDASGRVITVESAASSMLVPLVPLARAAGLPAPGSTVGPLYREQLAVASRLPGGLRAHVRGVEMAAGGGVALRLVDGPLALIGAPTDLAQKMVSLATILASVPVAHVTTIDLRVPAAPVLTP